MIEDPTAIVARSVEDLILLVYRRGGQVDGPGTDALTSTQRLVLVLLADNGPVRVGALARLPRRPRPPRRAPSRRSPGGAWRNAAATPPTAGPCWPG